MDPAELRLKNFIQKEQFPYKSATGFVYDSGDYQGAMDLALEKIGYAELRKEQEEARAEGKLYGIGLASFTEVVGAGPHKDYDILGLKMNDGAELRIHPTGKAILKISVPDAGPGPRDDVRADRGRGDRHPARGHQGHARRHGQHAVRPGHLRVALDARRRARRPRWWRAGSARRRASSPRTCWRSPRRTSSTRPGKFSVKGAPDKVKTIQEVAFAAYTNFPEGMEAGLEGVLLLRPAEPDVPVRDLRRGGRGRPRHRRVEGAPDGGRRRLRRPDQPDDRRGADPRRAHRGLRRSRRWS